MKRISFVIALTFGISYPLLFSQLTLNLSAGINNSDIALNERSDIPFGSITEPTPGYFIEVGPRYQITQKVSFGLYTQFSQKGFAYHERSFDKSIWRFTYLDFIPEIEYQLLSFLSISGGPYLGIKLQDADRLSKDEPWNSTNSLFPSSSDHGIAIKLKIQAGGFYVFTRFIRGRKRLAALDFTFKDGQFLTNTSVFNKIMQYGLGYSLKL